nr:biotin/lipoate A/B protein ligase family protein [Listeria sp. PSOL-1]
MAVDEKLADWHRSGLIQPTLRFYGWNPPGLTVGHFQKARTKIDSEAVKKHQFEMVRRQTGGQAVLHDNELTYSFIISENHSQIPQTIKAAHKLISEALLVGLHQIGIQADFAVPKDKRPKGTAICFEEPSWYEITYEQKKIIGSAQARLQGILLQHGSIPLSMDENDLFDLFIFDNPRVKERMKRSFSNKASGIYDILKKEITLSDLKQAFKDGFSKIFDVTFEPLMLSEQNWEEIYTLAETKYKNNDYNWSR